MTGLNIAIAGAGGRMGGALARAIAAADGVTIHSAFERTGNAAIGRYAGTFAGLDPLGVVITDDIEAALGADLDVEIFEKPHNTEDQNRRASCVGLVNVIV
jgi:4-hydroxy-tetrahydrodipicolinate reductase